jgi:hypothetical protein
MLNPFDSKDRKIEHTNGNYKPSHIKRNALSEGLSGPLINFN